jgi:hypothetical protein
MNNLKLLYTLDIPHKSLNYKNFKIAASNQQYFLNLIN